MKAIGDTVIPISSASKIRMTHTDVSSSGQQDPWNLAGIIGGGGGGGFGGGGMESRIAKLESDVGHIQSDLAEVKADIRDIRSAVSDMKTNPPPTRKEFYRALSGAVGVLLLATIAAAFSTYQLFNDDISYVKSDFKTDINAINSNITSLHKSQNDINRELGKIGAIVERVALDVIQIRSQAQNPQVIPENKKK